MILEVDKVTNQGLIAFALTRSLVSLAPCPRNARALAHLCESLMVLDEPASDALNGDMVPEIARWLRSSRESLESAAEADDARLIAAAMRRCAEAYASLCIAAGVGAAVKQAASVSDISEEEFVEALRAYVPKPKN